QVNKKGGSDASIAPPLAVNPRKGRNLDAASASRRTSAADETLALGALARQLAGAANGLGLLAGALLGRLLIMSAHLHLAENAFALHLFLERAKRLVNIVVTDEYLHLVILFWPLMTKGTRQNPHASAAFPPRNGAADSRTPRLCRERLAAKSPKTWR